MINVLPILIVTKAPVTLFMTLLVNAMEIRRDINTVLQIRDFQLVGQKELGLWGRSEQC